MGIEGVSPWKTWDWPIGLESWWALGQRWKYRKGKEGDLGYVKDRSWVVGQGRIARRG